MKIDTVVFVLTEREGLSIGTPGFGQSPCPPQQVSASSVKQMITGKPLLHLRLIQQDKTGQGAICHRDGHGAVQFDDGRGSHAP